MPPALSIMFGLGVVVGLIGLPILLAPDTLRAAAGWRKTPQFPYIMRIVGTMVTALGLILIVFSTAFWRFSV